MLAASLRQSNIFYLPVFHDVAHLTNGYRFAYVAFSRILIYSSKVGLCFRRFSRKDDWLTPAKDFKWLCFKLFGFFTECFTISLIQQHLQTKQVSMGGPCLTFPNHRNSFSLNFFVIFSSFQNFLQHIHLGLSLEVNPIRPFHCAAVKMVPSETSPKCPAPHSDHWHQYSSITSVRVVQDEPVYPPTTDISRY